MEIYYETERYEPPPAPPPALRNQPQRYVPRGAAVKRLDHVNLLAQDVRANRVFAQDVLGYRLYEQVVLDDGTEAGAWLSASIAAHELIYVADALGARGRLHHLAFWVDTREEVLRAADVFLEHDVYIEAAPSKHTIAQGFFLYGIEPGGNRIEVTTAGTSSTTRRRSRSSGRRRSVRAGRRGVSRPWRASTSTGRLRSRERRPRGRRSRAGRYPCDGRGSHPPLPPARGGARTAQRVRNPRAQCTRSPGSLLP